MPADGKGGRDDAGLAEASPAADEVVGSARKRRVSASAGLAGSTLVGGKFPRLSGSGGGSAPPQLRIRVAAWSRSPLADARATSAACR